MNGPPDWPSDENIGGPYGYIIAIVQRGGIRFSCDGPVVATAGPKDLYRALVAVQKRLLSKRPRSLKKAFAVTEKVRVPPAV